MRLETKGPSGRKAIVTAPTGGLSNDEVVILRSGTSGLCGTVIEGAPAGGKATVEYGHAVRVPKETGSGNSFDQGALVYRKAADGKAVPNSTSNTLMGWALEAASTSDTHVWVQFNIQ